MQPGMQSMGMPMQQSMPAATMAPQQSQPQSNLHMLRVDKGQSATTPAQKPRAAAAPKPAAAKPAAKQPAQHTAPAPVEAGPRIQPRNQPMATPGSGKKRLVYAAVFVVIALGVGAFVAKMVLSVL
jgi:hypothetical protein